jgi:hypothetical protein
VKLRVLAQGLAWLVAFVVSDAAPVPPDAFPSPRAPSRARARVVRVS